jgi:pyruvate/2-oxoglutarate dehydrogenase complex dihydrolipoamide dehydrogenase (E3) component
VWVKLVAERSTGRLLGAQVVGAETAGKRIDTLAMAVWTGMAVDELQWVDLAYAPPVAPVLDPVLVAARVAARELAS